jgi:hypothetical protein
VAARRRDGASGEAPLALEGIRERFLPGCTFRGRQNCKLQFAVLAAAALRGGAEPDLLDDAAWWQTDDFWHYALFAAVAYVHAAASRASAPMARHASSWPSTRATQRHKRPSGAALTGSLRFASPV